MRGGDVLGALTARAVPTGGNVTPNRAGAAADTLTSVSVTLERLRAVLERAYLDALTATRCRVVHNANCPDV